MSFGYFFCGDILGFSNIIRNLDAKKLENRINEWLALVKETAKNNHIEKFQLISDTVFAAVNDSESDLKKLVGFVRDLLNAAILKSLPIRGAIKLGEFTWQKQFVYGPAVIRAHEIEKDQAWVGVCLDCDYNIPEESWHDIGIICYPVPMTSGQIRLSPAILWDVPSFEELTKKMTSGGLTKDREVLYWKWGNKIGNTIIFKLYFNTIKKDKKPHNIFQGLHPVHFLDRMLAGSTVQGNE